MMKKNIYEGLVKFLDVFGKLVVDGDKNKI
jgi:hypothetical protein